MTNEINVYADVHSAYDLLILFSLPWLPHALADGGEYFSPRSNYTENSKFMLAQYGIYNCRKWKIIYLVLEKNKFTEI